VVRPNKGEEKQREERERTLKSLVGVTNLFKLFPSCASEVREVKSELRTFRQLFAKSMSSKSSLISFVFLFRMPFTRSKGTVSRRKKAHKKSKNTNLRFIRQISVPKDLGRTCTSSEVASIHHSEIQVIQSLHLGLILFVALL